VSTTVPGQHVAGTLTVLLHAVIAQVRTTVGSLPSTPTLYVVVLVVMAFAGIIIPAVWSKRPARRKAAAEVLDRILRFLRPGA